MNMSSRIVLLSITTAVFATTGAFTLTLPLRLYERATRAEARLEAMRTAIKNGAKPRPINCGEYIGQPWAGHVLLKDWPEGEPKPEVCHLKPEVERLGLVPKDQI